MLLKNNKEFEIPEEHKKELKEKFQKYPVVLKYHNSKIVFDKENKVKRKPQTLAIQTTVSAKIGDQVDQYTYATNTRLNSKGHLVVTPTAIEVNGSLAIKEGNLDLLWFLYYCAPKIQNNKMKDRSPYFVFENREEDARREEDKVKRNLKVQNLIYNDEIGLKGDELKEIAKTFDIKVDMLSLSETRIQLDKRVSANDIQYNTFIKRVAALKDSSSGELTENIVEQALKDGVIVYDHTKFTYHFTDPLTGEAGSVLTKMRSTKKEEAPKVLAEVLANKKDVLTVLKREMASRKEKEEAPL